MKGIIRRITIPSNEGAFYFDVYDCGRVIVNVWSKRVLKQHASKSGYLRVWATATDGKRKSFLVHRLVAMAHLDFKENREQLQVNHIDADKGNNSASNLEWVTKQENMNHGKKLGLFPGRSHWSKNKHTA